MRAGGKDIGVGCRGREETRGLRGREQCPCQTQQNSDIPGGALRPCDDRPSRGPDYSFGAGSHARVAIGASARFSQGLRGRNSPFPKVFAKVCRGRERVPKGTLHSEIASRHTHRVRQPWNALTTLVAHPDAPLERAGDAWEEAAARLGLTRLGWRRRLHRDAPQEFAFAFPSLRAVTRWRALGSHPVGGGPGSADEDIARVTEDGGELIASAPRGQLPGPGTLRELCTLASALETRRAERVRLALADRRADQARRTVAAGHDLRNELTRALLFQSRGSAEDRLEVSRALDAARTLAQDALVPESMVAAQPLEPLMLRKTLADECGAATHSARVSSGAFPKLRMRCAQGLQVLARPQSFRRAVRNLVTNALEAASWMQTRQGTVSVSVQPTPTEHPWQSHGFGVVLAIEDDGLGMDEYEVAHYLSPKGRGAAQQETAFAKPGSTGLGTASLSLALETGGIPIRVTSAPRRGTRVELFLREALDPPAKILIDRDVRRGPNAAQSCAGSEQVWWVNSADAGRLLSPKGMPPGSA